MNPIVHLIFRYNEIDYVRAYRTHLASQNRFRFDVFVAVCVLCIGLYLAKTPGSHWYGLAAIIVSLLFGLLLFVGFTIVPRIAFRRQPKFKDEYNLTFSSEGIHFKTAHIDSDLQWTLYSRAIVDRWSYLLYHGRQEFTVIPQRVFSSTEQREAFETFLKQHFPQIEWRSA